MTHEPKKRIAGAGSAIGKVAAAQGPMPGVGQNRPVEGPNTLHSRSTARFLDMLGEGPMVGLATGDARSVFLNDVPVMNPNGSVNFPGISITQRTGERWGFQDHIPGFQSAANVVPVAGGSGQLVGGFDTGGATVQLNNAEADAAIVRLQTPQMYTQDQNDGDVTGNACYFQIYIQPDGGAFTLAVDSVIQGKTMSPYQRDIRIDLPPGGAPWTIQVVRTSPPVPNPSFEKNDIYLISVTEVIDSKLAYHNTAYVGTVIDTSQFSGGAPSRSYDVMGLYVLVPTNYDNYNRTYGGDWDGTWRWAWTDNPVWCYLDLLRNERYGVGLPMEALEPWKWELYQIAQYSDERIPDGIGGTQPRFSCNMILNSQQEAYVAINTMASIFRGMCYWSSGAVRTTADMPKAPVALVTNSNVIGGEFKYEGTALKARHSICKVVWNDPEDSFRPHVEYVEHQEALAKYGPRQTDIVAYGATSRAQAIRAGKWLLDTENTATETVHFRGGLDMAGIFPGMIVEVADQDYTDSVIGGRVATADANLATMTIDRDYEFEEGKAYTIDVMLPSGAIGTRTLTNSPGTTRVLTWAGLMPELPLNGAVWVIRSTSLQPRQFLIVSNIEVGDATFELMGLFHDPAKYDRVEFGIIVPPPPYSMVPTGDIKPPTNLAAMIRLFRSGSAINASAILSWSKADDSRVYAYEVQVRGPEDQSFVNVGIETFNTIEYKGVVEGTHTFRVRSISMTGKTSVWSEQFTTELTSDIPPSDVTELVTTYDPSGVAFKWKPNVDLNLDHYEVRRGVSWDEGTVVAVQSNTTYVEKGVATGSFTYWVKAVTTDGKFSTNAASIVIEIAGAPAPTVAVALVDNEYAVTWNQVFGSFLVDHYELRVGGTSWDTATPLGTTKATVWQAPIAWVGVRKFWVAAIDVFGNRGVAGAADLFIQGPSAVSNLTAQIVDNNVMLRWTASVAGRLPIKHYEIRKGDVFGPAEVIGTKQGTFTTVFETVAGLFTYWVAAVDTANNYGPGTAVVARVQQPPDYVLHTDIASDFGVANQAGTLTRLAPGDSQAGLLIPDYEVAGETIKFSIWLKEGTETGDVTLRITNGDGSESAANTVTPTSTWTRFEVSKTFSGGAEPDIKVYLDPDNDSGSFGSTLHIFRPEVSHGPNLDLLVTTDWNDDFYGLSSDILWEPGTLHGPFDGVGTQMAPEESTLFGPVNNTETWEEHFQDNDWETPQEQVDDGHPLYIQPVPASGTYVEIIDFEAVIPSTMMSVNLTKQDVSGDVGVTCQIETSLDAEDWSLVSTSFQGLASNFRYARVTLTFTSDGDSLTNVGSLHYVLSLKLKIDNGTAQVFAADSGGTEVFFNVPYIDVRSINVTPAGTAPVTAIYDFDDAPNPVSFKILLFDVNGDRVNGTVSWTTRGV